MSVSECKNELEKGRGEAHADEPVEKAEEDASKVPEPSCWTGSFPNIFEISIDTLRDMVVRDQHQRVPALFE